jgi:hypothetical protein
MSNVTTMNEPVNRQIPRVTPGSPLETQIVWMEDGGAVLCHGTRYLNRILASNQLSVGHDGLLWFADTSEEALNHAMNGPRFWDDGTGAILYLDRAKLSERYHLQRFSRGIDAEEYLQEPVMPLTEFALAYLRLEDLSPGLGVFRPLITRPKLQRAFDA